MLDREQLHHTLNEKFPRFAQHLPFDQRDGIVREVEAVLGAEKDAEIARLRAFCQEFIWNEEHPEGQSPPPEFSPSLNAFRRLSDD